jgi:CPA1 family monovalent cation:H+ antiporter
VELKEPARRLLEHIDFNEAVRHGMLSLLLFAGAMHLDVGDLRKQKGAVAMLATVGVVASTIIVGALSWLVLRGLGFGPSWMDCFLFGALISPTDPIAVLDMLKHAGVPRSLQAKMAGESLFNDGIGVVVFLTLLAAAHTGHVSAAQVSWLLASTALGGALLGVGIGLVGFHFLKRVDHYQVEVLITLAIATGGYALAEALGVSAPIAIVVAGLFLGSVGRARAMSDDTRERLDTFWQLIDEILNAILFLLIGLEVLVMPFTPRFILAGAALIPITLLARWLSVGGVVGLMRRWRSFGPGAVALLTWGGLRGGISVAMALSLPSNEHRNAIVAVTYQVVVFSIIVQGLTIGWVVKRATRELREPAAPLARAVRGA